MLNSRYVSLMLQDKVIVKTSVMEIFLFKGVNKTGSHRRGTSGIIGSQRESSIVSVASDNERYACADLFDIASDKETISHKSGQYCIYKVNISRSAYPPSQKLSPDQ